MLTYSIKLFNIVYNYIFTIHRHRYYKRIVKQYLKNNPQPKITSIEKKEIRNYWDSANIKINDYSWFQWYYGITGIKNPAFVPCDIFDQVLLPIFNDQTKKNAWRDKCYFEQFLPVVTFPRTILKKVNGLYYDENGYLIIKNDLEKIISLLKSEKEIIIKLGIGSCGKEVGKYLLSTDNDVLELIRKYQSDKCFIIQEVIKQHSFFDQFNDSSVNIIRIYTLFHNGNVIIPDNAMIRFGVAGYHTDVAFINGKEIVNAVSVNKDGTIKPYYWDLYGNKKPLKNINRTDIPMWDEVRKTVIEGAMKMPYFALIGWDVTINDKNEVIVIEYNIDYPGSIIYQYEQPFFGEYTDQLLLDIKKSKAVPRYYKVRKKGEV